MVIFGNYTLTFVMSSFVMSLPLLHPKTQGHRCVLGFNLLPCCYISLSYIMVFDIQMIHRRIQTARSHASRCHHCHDCNVDFVLFHNVTCYTNYLLSCIHVNTTNPLDITRTLAATCVILGRLECVGFEPIISKSQPVYL